MARSTPDATANEVNAPRTATTGAVDASDLSTLRQPAAHPDDPSAKRGVEWVQTHLSHVLLTEARVYKFRKSVDFEFVRFSTRAERNVDCDREVTLNRRLAPNVYLGVAPLLGSGADLRIGPVVEHTSGEEDPPEYCVVMRRLRAGRDAQSLLEKDALSVEMLDRVAERIATFHEGVRLGKPAPFTADGWHERCLDPVEQNFRALAAAPDGVAPAGALHEVAADVRSFGERHAELFDIRRRAGRAVDGHGDLHLQHIWFESDDASPLIIDCIEFNERLRQIDAASDAAFPAMDLRYRGHARLAERLLRSYARTTDDYGLYSVIDFFIAYRAAVRAKVAAIAAEDAAISPDQRARATASARAHLELAAEVARPRDPGALVIVSGVVGSGKSTVAQALADRAGGVVIASDHVRKRLAGLPPERRATAPLHRGLYSEDAIDRAYAAVLDRARPVVQSGRPAILDATFALRRHRAEVAELAEELGTRVRCLEVRCGEDVALERLARRAEAGGNASDAGPELYRESVARFEPVVGEGHLDVIHSDQPDWHAALGSLARDL